MLPRRCEVYPDYLLVPFVCPLSNGVPNGIGEPALQVLRDGHAPCFVGESGIAVRHYLYQLLCYLRVCPTVDGLALRANQIAGLPTPVLAPSYSPLAVTSPPGHRSFPS